jgi:hypothetical protein
MAPIPPWKKFKEAVRILLFFVKIRNFIYQKGNFDAN